MFLPTTSPRDLLAWLSRQPGVMVICSGGKRPLGCAQGGHLTQKARVPVLFQIASQNGQYPTPSHIPGSALFGQMWAQQCQAGLSKACLCQMMVWSCWVMIW